MKKIVWIVAVLVWIVAISGCSKKFCQKNYPCNDIDSVMTINSFDTAYIKVPGDTTYIELPFDCPDQQVIYRDGKKEIVYKIKNRVLTVNEVTFADSIRIINQFKESKEFKQYAKTIEVPVPFIPKWIKYWLLGLHIWLIWAYRKNILSLLKLIFARFM